jgi:hypothetical protein
MKKIIKNWISFIIALIGLIIGGIWAYKSSWDFEPIIISSVSLIEIIGFFVIKKDDSNTQSNLSNNKSQINTQNVNVSVNIPTESISEENKNSNNQIYLKGMH